MPIMIKDIPSLMIQELEILDKDSYPWAENNIRKGYNRAIEQKGTRKIRTNREKLAKLIHEAKMIGMTKHYQIDYKWCLQIADAIELNLKNILESCE